MKTLRNMLNPLYMSTDKEIAAKIGQEIKKGRLQIKLTQEELAKQVGISREQLVRIEKTGKMTLLTLIAITRVFNSLDMLLDVYKVPELNARELFELGEKKQKMINKKPKRIRNNG